MRALWTGAGAVGVAQAVGLLGADDARVSGAGAEGHVPGGRFHGQRRNQRPSGEDCGGGEFRSLAGESPAATPQPHVTVDFSGSDPQVQGSINAVEAITYSACFYVFRCLLAEDVPATSGLMRPIHVIAPAGTVVNARPPAAVAGGMSNLATDRGRSAASPGAGYSRADSGGGFGNHEQSHHRRNGSPVRGEPFAYYETIAGGMGARPTKPGVSGVHTHMTNSLNTPAEALEYSYPLRVRQYSLRPGSGGDGRHRGGDGIIREIEVLTEAEVTLLSDRRRNGPWGLSGGADGLPGNASVVRADGSIEKLAGKSNVRLRRANGFGLRLRAGAVGGNSKNQHR